MPFANVVTAQLLHDRIVEIAAVLAKRDDALALLALGSLGRECERADAWSDLDFFVLVAQGAKARYIDDLDWLAAAHPVAWNFRNTVDGHKALMSDGVLCEFAIFEIAELRHVPYSAGRFVWRRECVSEELAFPVQPLPRQRDKQWLIGEALSNLLVGLLRHARGERLSGMRMVQVHAVDRILELLEIGHPPPESTAASRDPFSVERRIEARAPSIRDELPVWAGGYLGTCQAAISLLEKLQECAEIPTEVSNYIRSLAGFKP